MITDDKIGIGYGLMGVFQNDAKFVTFDGTNFHLDALRLTEHLSTIARAGANFVRVLPWGVWGSHPGQKKATQFQPYVLKKVGTQELWNLDAFNTYYFPIVKEFFTIANGVGLTVLWDLFDNCQLHGSYSKWSPWVNNTQGVLSFYDKKADVYTKRWVSTMTLRHQTNDVIWGFGNELENPDAPDFVKRAIFPYITLRNLEFRRLTYGATVKDNGALDSIQDTIRKSVREKFGLVAEKDVIIEDHGWPWNYGLSIWGSKPYCKLFSDDGFYGGLSICDRRDKGARPSASQWKTRVKYVLANYPVSMGGRPRLISFEHLPGIYPPDNTCQSATIRAISSAYKEKFNVWPHNYRST